MSFDLRINNQGDLNIGRDGDIEKVVDTDKLIQDILKIALTPIGSNTFFPAYGSNISKNLIGTPFNLSLVGPLAEDQLSSSLNTLLILQRLQSNSKQNVSPYELLAAIQKVEIERNITDPRYFSVMIRVLSKALISTATTFDIGSF